MKKKLLPEQFGIMQFDEEFHRMMMCGTMHEEMGKIVKGIDRERMREFIKNVVKKYADDKVDLKGYKAFLREARNLRKFF